MYTTPCSLPVLPGRAHFRLKAPEVRHQARLWARDDASLKGLAAQVGRLKINLTDERRGA